MPFITKLQAFRTKKSSGGRPEYRLKAPLKYLSPLLVKENFMSDVFDEGIITVPINFVTDFASIPWPLYKVLRPDGPWDRASVIHDFLCRMANHDKETAMDYKHADDIFYEAARSDGVWVVTAFLFWGTIRIFHKFSG